MDKAIKKQLETAFYDYRKNYMSATCNLLNDIADRNLTAKYDKLPVKSSGRSGIDDLLIKYIDRDMQTYKWCKVVEKTLDYFYGEYKDKLIKKFYFERKGINRTVNELNISRRTFFYWLDEILLKAEFWAREYNLIR